MSGSADVSAAPLRPVIRQLWNPDQPAISRHFSRFDTATRRMRFGGGASAEFAEAYARRMLRMDAVVFGAFYRRRLRGIGELRGLAPPEAAEAAFSVEPQWQNRGIGNALMRRIVFAAQNRGVRTLHMMCLPQNDRMLHLASKHDAVLRVHRLEVEATLDPPWPTPFSVVAEVFGEAEGFVEAILRW